MARRRDLAAVLTAAFDPPRKAMAELGDRVRREDDPDSLHDLRVAVRRLQSLFRMFSPVLDGRSVASVRAELAWLSRSLGAVRDLDVQIELLDSRLAAIGQHHRGLELMSRLLDGRVRARRALLGDLESARYRELLAALRKLVKKPPLRPSAGDADAAAALRLLANRSLRRLDRAVEDLPAEPADEQLHEVRLLVKRARYATEVVARLADPEAKPLSKRLADLQELLGDFQDASVARAWLGDAARSSSDAEEAFVLGELAGALRGEQADLRRRWPAAWARASRRKLRRWL